MLTNKEREALKEPEVGVGEHLPVWYEVAFTYFYMAEVPSDISKKDVATMAGMILAFSRGNLDGMSSPLAGPN